MNSNDSLFEDIEQDNNPSLYGNKSIFKDPYGQLGGAVAQKNDNDHQSSGVTQLGNGSLSIDNERNSVSNEPKTAHISTSTHEDNDLSDDFSYGHRNSLINSTIGLSNKIHEYINDPTVVIDVISTERLVNTTVIIYSISLSMENAVPIIVKRRYSEFESLHSNLAKLYPTVVLPSVPAKHSIITYLVNTINNEGEVSLVESRKRYFKLFLIDLVEIPKIRDSSLLHKFFDPNYEMHWNHALNEPPVNVLPNNLLLANPLDPTDRNGLYSLLPQVRGFEFDSTTDNLPTLKKANDDVLRLTDQLKSSSTGSQVFSEIPPHLILFEKLFKKNVKIMNDLSKVNSKTLNSLKSIVGTLIELGGNLNNFSLQVYDNQSADWSMLIEKLGSTFDSNFLNFEAFIIDNFIPEWQEPINQLINYYMTSIQLIKFYKFKLIQLKLVHKLKFNKENEFSNFNSNFQSQANLDNLKELEDSSPTIRKAIRSIEMRKQKGGGLRKKSSWYGLFGGNKQPQFSLEESTINDDMDMNSQFKQRMNHIEKELNKLDQLVELSNDDMTKLSKELHINFHGFLAKIEKKWLIIMIEFIRSGKALFEKNLSNWSELKDFIGKNTL